MTTSPARVSEIHRQSWLPLLFLAAVLCACVTAIHVIDQGGFTGAPTAPL